MPLRSNKDFIDFLDDLSEPHVLDQIQRETHAGGGRLKSSKFLQEEVDKFDSSLECDTSGKGSSAECLIRLFLKYVKPANVLEAAEHLTAIIDAYYGTGSNSKAAKLTSVRKRLLKVPHGQEMWSMVNDANLLVGSKTERKARTVEQTQARNRKRANQVQLNLVDIRSTIAKYKGDRDPWKNSISLLLASGLRQGELLNPLVSLFEDSPKNLTRGDGPYWIRQVGLSKDKSHPDPMGRIGAKEVKKRKALPFEQQQALGEQVEEDLAEEDVRFCDKPLIDYTAEEFVENVAYIRGAIQQEAGMDFRLYPREVVKEKTNSKLVRAVNAFVDIPGLKQQQHAAVGEGGHVKPHSLRAIYAAASYRLYGSNQDFAYWTKHVLCHESDTAALSYSVISLDPLVRAGEAELTDDVQSLQEEVKRLKQDLQFALLEQGAAGVPPNSVKILNDDGVGKVFPRRVRRVGKTQDEVQGEIEDAVSEFLQQDVAPTGSNLKKLGFGSAAVNVWKRNNPQWNMRRKRHRVQL